MKYFFKLIKWLVPGVIITYSMIFARSLSTQKILLLTLNWSPYVGEEFPNNGSVYLLVKKAFEKMGYLVEIEFKPWNRVIAIARKGKVDAFFPVYYSKERTKYFYMSNPVFGGPIVFLTRREYPITHRNIEALKTYRIGLVKGYVNTEEIDQANFLKKDFAPNDLINIKKLIKGRVDLIVIDKYVAYYLIKKYFPNHISKLKVLSPSIEYKNLYVCFPKKRKNSKKLLQDFNTGLSQLKKDGTVDKIFNNWKKVLSKEVLIEDMNN
ncbi:transporter substrate-binding domain-containing protein [Desulfothermus naphthae]